MIIDDNVDNSDCGDYLDSDNVKDPVEPDYLVINYRHSNVNDLMLRK